ncbi:MAG TPA: hypothetical protein VH333_23015 [Pseudonocardiaceae bacterium]|jgi:hypothetical protein|nr:hypothetical protein [Pseudonocardiaceae bacterium]
MQEGGAEPKAGNDSSARPAAGRSVPGRSVSGDRRRANANYRYFGTILFLGALVMILLMVLLHR